MGVSGNFRVTRIISFQNYSPGWNPALYPLLHSKESWKFTDFRGSWDDKFGVACWWLISWHFTRSHRYERFRQEEATSALDQCLMSGSIWLKSAQKTTTFSLEATSTTTPPNGISKEQISLRLRSTHPVMCMRHTSFVPHQILVRLISWAN